MAEHVQRLKGRQSYPNVNRLRPTQVLLSSMCNCDIVAERGNYRLKSRLIEGQLDLPCASLDVVLHLNFLPWLFRNDAAISVGTKRHPNCRCRHASASPIFTRIPLSRVLFLEGCNKISLGIKTSTQRIRRTSAQLNIVDNYNGNLRLLPYVTSWPIRCP